MSAANLFMLSRRKKEKLKVYNPNTVKEIVEDASKISHNDSRAFTAPEGSSRSLADGTLVMTQTNPSLVNDLAAGMGDAMRDRARAQREARMNSLRECDAQFHAQLKRQTEERRRRQDARFDREFTKVLADVAGESAIMQDTQYTLDFSERVRRKKQEGLHSEWHQEVFDKIQNRLQASLSSRDPRDIEAVWNEEYDKYLNTTNVKVGVYRDVIIEKDYNPFYATNRTIKVPTGDIRDPVKRDLQKRLDEQSIIMSGPSVLGTRTGGGGGGMGNDGISNDAVDGKNGSGNNSSSNKDNQTGRETLDTKLWGSDRIRSTPYCHCVDDQGNYVLQPPPEVLPRAKVTAVELNQYQFPTGRACTDKEMGKWRGVAPGPEVRRGRRDLRETIQWQKPGDKAFPGDIWLEYKGKRTGADMELTGAGTASVSTFMSDVIKHGFLLGSTGPSALPPPPHEVTAMAKRKEAAAVRGGKGGGGGGGGGSNSSSNREGRGEIGRGVGGGGGKKAGEDERAGDVTLPFGDKWLDYKGRRVVPGPEELRGRKDLHETFKQASNPYEDGRTLGDSWLEYRGRRPVPVEKRQTSNPIVST